MPRQKDYISYETQGQMDALKTFLTPSRPISKRAAMYRLLSMGLLESTKDFPPFNRKMNLALANPKVRDDNFNDECFVDNRRVAHSPWNFEAIGEFKKWCSRQYHRNPWQTQSERVEVWLEKDTIAALVQETTTEMDVVLRVSAGNFSRTFLWNAAKETEGTLVPYTILYAGDFDPNGLSIEESARKVFEGFLHKEHGWSQRTIREMLRWERVGVTEAEYWAIAEKARVPCKEGDTRTKKFVEQYSSYGVEVEALEVAEAGGLASRLRTVIHQHIDMELWDQEKVTETAELKEFAMEAVQS